MLSILTSLKFVVRYFIFMTVTCNGFTIYCRQLVNDIRTMERQLVEHVPQNNNVQEPQDNAPTEPAANVQAQPVAGPAANLQTHPVAGPGIERRQRHNDARDNIARSISTSTDEEEAQP